MRFGAFLTRELMALLASPANFPLISAAPRISTGPKNYHLYIRRSRYDPHQGKRECARRLRKMAA